MIIYTQLTFTKGLAMFHDRFVKKENPQVDQVLEQTKLGNLRWQNKEFTEKSRTDWKIGFTADDGTRELLLEKESFLENGGWISTDISMLKVKDKNTGQESAHTFYTSSDYVETLNESGYPGVSSLARYVIDQFRSSMNLHWSVM